MPGNGRIHIIDEDCTGEKGLDNGPHAFVTAHNFAKPTTSRRRVRFVRRGLKRLVDDDQGGATGVRLLHHGQSVHRSRPSSHNDRVGEIAEHGCHCSLGAVVDVDLLGEGAHHPRHSRVHHNGSGVRPLQAKFKCLAGGFGGGSLALHASLLLSQPLHLGVGVLQTLLRAFMFLVEPHLAFTEADDVDLDPGELSLRRLRALLRLVDLVRQARDLRRPRVAS